MSRPAIARGDVIAERYVVVEIVGMGGMGAVARAYDPKLCRELALKRLKRDALDREGEARLVREAQSMARLSHPHVVSVYDVVSDRGSVTIAMEYVPGTTLRTWMKTARSQPEILALFRQAGVGLAAAHAAGLVHRDFKPSNVLITDDGRAKVTDFGLAKAIDSSSSVDRLARLSAHSWDSHHELSADLTEPNVVMGTPRYMAPEQHRGAPAGPPADQFAYCVALWDALVGAPPFSSRDGRDKREGPPPWPKSTDVPRALQDVIRRGLCAHAEDRWPSMDELLAALDYDPSRRRRRWASAAGLVVVVGVAAGLTRARGQPNQAKCNGAPAKLEGIWDSATRDRVQQGILTHGTAQDWSKVAAKIDAYTTDWQDLHREVCEATNVRGEQSTQIMDLRMRCLDGALRDLRAAVEVLREADAQTVSKAETLAGLPPPLRTCSDIEALAAEVPPPSDPEVAAEVRDAELNLTVARALMVAGKYPQTLTLLEVLEPRARSLEYGPLIARTLMLEGEVVDAAGRFQDAIAHHEQAIAFALEHGVTRTAIEAASNLAWLTAYELNRPDEGRAWAIVAQGLVRFYEPGGTLEADVEQTLAALAHARGDFEASESHLRRALSMSKPDSGAAASVRYNLGASLYAQGKHAEAIEVFEEVIAAFEKIYGDEHPAIADTLDSMGSVLREMDRTEEAEAALQRALKIRMKLLGERHPDTAATVFNLAAVAEERGRVQDALVGYRRALEIWGESLSPNHPTIVTTLVSLAQVEFDRGRAQEAETTLRRARDVALDGHATPDVRAEISFALALARWELGQQANARKLAVEAQNLLHDLPAEFDERRREIDRWLQTHM